MSKRVTLTAEDFDKVLSKALEIVASKGGLEQSKPWRATIILPSLEMLAEDNRPKALDAFQARLIEAIKAVTQPKASKGQSRQ